jgi:hypothetical protein
MRRFPYCDTVSFLQGRKEAGAHASRENLRKDRPLLTVIIPLQIASAQSNEAASPDFTRAAD